jgi:hypothetical protein
MATPSEQDIEVVSISAQTLILAVTCGLVWWQARSAARSVAEQSRSVDAQAQTANVQTLLIFDERWNSPRMRKERSQVAGKVLVHLEGFIAADEKSPTRQTRGLGKEDLEVADFFEGLAICVEQLKLDEKIVGDFFGDWLRFYWVALSQVIELHYRKPHPQDGYYKHFEALARATNRNLQKFSDSDLLDFAKLEIE